MVNLQVRAEKPAWYLAVISGALLRTLDFVSARSAEYLGYLEKGQLPPARLTLTAFEEAFVLEGKQRNSVLYRQHFRCFVSSLHYLLPSMKAMALSLLAQCQILLRAVRPHGVLQV